MNSKNQNAKHLAQYQCKEERRFQFGLSQGQTDVTSDQHEFCRPKSLVRIEQTTLWDSKLRRSADSKQQKKTIYYVEPLLTPRGGLDRRRLVLEILFPKPQMCR